MNKRAAIKWLDHWAEGFGFILLLLGLILSAFVNLVMSFISILLCGMIVGRLYYIKRHRRHASFYMVVIGFFLGYMIGSFIKGYSPIELIFIVIFFFVGTSLGTRFSRAGFWK
jgi:4-hydroxybenzoate polyprenyltransferase